MKEIKSIIFLLVILSLTLTACQPSRVVATATPTQTDPFVIYTAAANTAEARRALTATAFVTPTLAEPTATPTLAPTATQAVTVTPAQAATATLAPRPTGGDNSVFIEDRTIPDGSDFSPGAQFVKTWRLMNTGTTTWTTAYSLVFITGNSLGSPASVSVPLEVAPNQVVDISVNMVAPAASGNYKSYWRLRNTSGEYFGAQIYADIDVIGGTPGATITPGGPTPTPGGATSTPAPSGSGVVTGANIVLNDSNVTASCPYEFAVTSTFTLREAATVTYQFEAGSDIPGFLFNLPAPATVAFGAGEQTLTFSLNISDSGSGWVRLHVTSPNDVTSNKAEFTLTCLR